MLKKTKAAMNDSAAEDESKDLSQRVLDSSRQIWLAGLGAFARAQQEGTRMFEGLIAQGEHLESRTRKAAVETATAARETATAKAKEMQAMAGGTWDKLEQVFEDRVARALSKLGVHTQSDVERLTERVDALSEAVNQLIKASGMPRPAAARPRGTKTAARPAKAPKAAAKRPTPRGRKRAAKAAPATE